MKRIMLIVLIVLPFMCIKAQDVSGNEIKQKDSESGFKTTHVSSATTNWFVTISGGLGDLMSEQSNYVKFGDRAKPTMGFSVGKWMTPVWAVRLNFTAAKLQGFTLWDDESNLGLGDWYIGTNHPYPGQGTTNTYLPAYENESKGQFIKDRFFDKPVQTSTGSGYSYEVPYASGSIDFLLNLSNLFGSYNTTKLFNPILFGGIGYAHTIGDETRGKTNINSMMERFGFIFDFRLNKNWSVNAEAQALILPEMFDWRVGDGNTQDVIVNYMVGVTYKIKGDSFYKAQIYDLDEVASLNNEINSLRAANTQLSQKVAESPEYYPNIAKVVSVSESNVE